MRLKSLHIKGFKSFANETVLHFNNDVIGIVGPNGSGKSNVVDAIRWVLGEQKSKELRLESMSDVIFNGTKTRKEAASAMVELTFENDKGLIPSEYQNVAISRTLYRSGESEYRLNGVVCRLKDIKSLFIDTGIGSNSYAIIALGMVDDLLADKEDSRRNMFEQAAGISKYKIRKRETISKLNSTSADLDRVEDLLFEIDGNMKLLEKQAKRTKKYFELKEEYKQLSINNAVRSIQSLKENYKEINKDITEKQEKYSALQTEVTVQEANLEKEKKENLDKEVSVSQKQKELNELVSKLRNLEGEKSLLEQKTGFKKQSITNIEKIIQDNIRDLAQLETEIESLTSRVDAERVIETELRYKLDQAKEGLDKVKLAQSSVKTDFDEKTVLLQNLQRRQYELDKDVAVATNQLEGLNADIARSKEQLEASQGEWDILSSRQADLENKYDLKSQELEALKNQEEERKTKIIDLEARRDALQDELNKVNRTIDSRQNEYDLLKSMIESFEGFPESIKYLATNWRKDVPILSDLLDVDEEFKSVIEQYLEPYLNYYVVNDISEAMEAIKLLGGAQKGKANFFLLNKIKEDNYQPTAVPKAIAASSTIRIDSKFQKLLNHLLKDAYIFDGSMDDFKYDNDYDSKIFLSKSGTYLKTSTTVSGGSVGLFEGKRIGRKKNLEKLESILQKAHASRDKINTDLQAIRAEITGLKNAHKEGDIASVTRELGQIDQERIKANLNIENIKNVRIERQQRIEQNTLTIADLDKKIEFNKGKREEIKIEIEKEESSFRLFNEDLAKLNEELTQASELFNQSNIALIRQQSLIGNFSKDLEFKASRKLELSQRQANEEKRLKDDKAELIEAQAQHDVNRLHLLELYEEKKIYQGHLTEAEQAFFGARNVITEGEEKVRLLNRALNQLQIEINTLKDKFTDVKFKINAVGDRLNIEFNVALNDIINQEVDDTMPLEELTAKVEALRNKLSNYGEINPLALEAYEEIKGRYDTITTQRADILEAKNSLMLTIKELEMTATEQFMAAFEQVRLHFIEVFRSLFTEDDNCDLILLDPENPLESAIEIVAKPKGKKPKSLSQLSGGEKTLTATALLFALYLLKPAPFCIFDEVDAPLDDANIQKFNKIIMKFSNRSQFIIVTHNKATMAAVNVLYGVFMQEMGVSAVTEVDFGKFKDDSFLESLN